MKQQRVRFSDQLTTVICNTNNSTMMMEDESEQQERRLWYSIDELRDFKDQVRAIRRDPTTLDERDDCWRGLEPHVQERSEIRTARRRHARSVLKLQSENNRRRRRQNKRNSDRYDDDVNADDGTISLMLLSSQQSRVSVRRALVYAVHDYVEAQHCHAPSVAIPGAATAVAVATAVAEQQQQSSSSLSVRTDLKTIAAYYDHMHTTATGGVIPVPTKGGVTTARTA